MGQSTRLAGALLTVLSACGCAGSRPGLSYAPSGALRGQDATAAERNNQRGLSFVEQGDYAAAERCFREALAADPFCAAAHNNLGLILAEQHPYEGALELARAGKLAPRAVEPVINLGRLYERVGWMTEATTQYERAVALQPDHVDALGHLARAYLHTGKDTPATRELLQRLAQRAEADPWREWALAQLDGCSASTP